MNFFYNSGHDNFSPAILTIFKTAQLFGIPSYGDQLALLWSLVVLTMLLVLEIVSVWKLIRSLREINQNPGDSVSARLSGTIFYGNALLSLPISWKFLNNWKNLSNFWFIGIHHSGLKIPPDRSIRMRVIFVGWFVAVGAFDEYSVWLAIPIFIMSKLATILWNFQDLIIILISIGLASRYNQLNSYVKRIISYEKNEKNWFQLESNLVNRIMIWRKIRHAYLHQSKLVRRIDESLGLLVLLSNLNNLYFICLQLFLGIRTDNSELIEDIYYLYSLAWLLLRASFVVLAASEVAAVIVKYELIMLQYDKQS
ncbi:unnamed protein product [Leptidea sinapis]|uniref:Gustatory receptor n=1 Tax=Leptidea sinapis TaxID=189913 RepID=A0A5E4QXH3_9NEOP|nr:unnamed protein product [Leptidea sinapis]